MAKSLISQSDKGLRDKLERKKYYSFFDFKTEVAKMFGTYIFQMTEHDYEREVKSLVQRLLVVTYADADQAEGQKYLKLKRLTTVVDEL